MTVAGVVLAVIFPVTSLLGFCAPLLAITCIIAHASAIYLATDYAQFRIASDGDAVFVMVAIASVVQAGAAWGWCVRQRDEAPDFGLWLIYVIYYMLAFAFVYAVLLIVLFLILQKNNKIVFAYWIILGICSAILLPALAARLLSHCGLANTPDAKVEDVATEKDTPA